jgi:surface polysaccharide O-acyltransferase-like enzyme
MESSWSIPGHHRIGSRVPCGARHLRTCSTADSLQGVPRLFTTPIPSPASRTASPEGLAFTSYLRVVAIAAVVLVHSLSGMVTNEAVQDSLTWWVGTALNRGVSWCVPLFIMISGALLLAPRPGEGAGTFYRRRLGRIAIPLVVAHAGYLAVRAFLDHEALTPQVVIHDLLTAQVYTALYFFWIILGLYLVTPPLRAIIGQRSPRDVALFGGVALAWMWLVAASVPVTALTGGAPSPWQPAALTLWLPYVGYFVLGYALREVVLDRRGMMVAAATFLTADALVLWHYVAGVHNPTANILLGGGYQGVPVAISTIALFVIGRSVVHPASAFARHEFARPMRSLGNLTLGVFMGHLLVMRYAWHIPGLAFSQVKSDLPRALLLWAIVLVVTFVGCAVIARIPFIKRLIGM